jgi:hypothetical protein
MIEMITAASKSFVSAAIAANATSNRMKALLNAPATCVHQWAVFSWTTELCPYSSSLRPASSALNPDAVALYASERFEMSE